MFTLEDSNEELKANTMETTAMVDVIFILLAFFVVTSQLKEFNIPLKLTPTETGKAVALKNKVVIQMDHKNQLFRGDKKTTFLQLDLFLKKMDSKKRSKVAFLIRSDENAKSGTFLKVLDLFKKYGCSNINIGVRKKKGSNK